jgi:ribose 5-phosphate isomerase B
MKIAIGADHAGFSLKEGLREALAKQGLDIIDYGTVSSESTDYPDYAEKVARAVAGGEADCGVLVCSTGVGMSIAANKVRGVRAALAYNAEEVGLTRAHNNANVLAIGAKYTTLEQAKEMVDVFLATPFDGGRHERRVNKMMALEEKSE